MFPNAGSNGIVQASRMQRPRKLFMKNCPYRTIREKQSPASSRRPRYTTLVMESLRQEGIFVKQWSLALHPFTLIPSHLYTSPYNKLLRRTPFLKMAHLLEHRELGGFQQIWSLRGGELFYSLLYNSWRCQRS